MKDKDTSEKEEIPNPNLNPFWNLIWKFTLQEKEEEEAVVYSEGEEDTI